MHFLIYMLMPYNGAAFSILANVYEEKIILIMDKSCTLDLFNCF